MRVFKEMRIPALAALFLLLGLVPGTARVRAGCGFSPEGGRPELRLTVDRTVGMSPLRVTVRATFKGAPQNGVFCHPGVTWIVWSLDSHQVLRSSHRPRCHHTDSEFSVPHSFRKSFTLGRGIHICRLTIHGKDGTSVNSNLVRVRVL